MNPRRNFLAFSTFAATLATAPWLAACASSQTPTPTPTAAAGKPQSLPLATDLATDSRSATAQGIPLLVLFSLPGCPYCEAVRRSFLLPMLAEPTPRAVIRQIDIDSKQAVIDFKARTISHASFATEVNVSLTPVVAFYGPSGEELADRLIGAMLPDFYGIYLDQATAGATARIRDRNPQMQLGVDQGRLPR